MPLFSFGKKNKIKKMLEDGKIEEVVRKALEDKKVRKQLIELLHDENQGIVGDSLIAISTLLRENPNAIEFEEDIVKDILKLLNSKTAYVRDGAMALSLEIARLYGDKFRNVFKDTIERNLKEGDKNIVAFSLLLIRELKLAELKDEVKRFVDIEDKVMLPFEGMRWVKLGDIAKETLNSL
ncbi:hypothetical protein PNA2_1894 [Pyrococcus sp. NA2]|uniref:hypothetical protein n=1 Tax=Pyrococcus sp. (strain NA2) TaxID=342949 RepID=UPI000209ACF9|nr:hypothetical protein [Pyrococcus sp. NA2]AEC52807.1 hypothetical protein PNA2_1894 [Pyrococcus sp. NA2]